MTSTNSNSAVIASMFKHLTQSYTADEAREILVQKYPEQEGDINLLEVSVTREAVADAIETETAKLATAVKAKTAKPAKAPKAKAASKMDRARELYAKAKDQSRKAMLEVFNKELGLSKAAASTYYYTVKG